MNAALSNIGVTQDKRQSRRRVELERLRNRLALNFSNLVGKDPSRQLSRPSASHGIRDGSSATVLDHIVLRGAEASKEKVKIIIHTGAEYGGLCERCRGLNSLEGNIIINEQGNLLWDFSVSLTIQEAKTRLSASCGFCAIFQRMAMGLDTSSGARIFMNSPLKWYGNSMTMTHGFKIRSNHHASRNSMYLIPAESISYMEEDGLKPPVLCQKIDTERADFGLIKQWINECCNDHQQSCCVSSSDQMPDLKVIECSSGRLVGREPHLPYAALSYVWGQPAAGTETSTEGFHLDNAPKTISDAMTVALRLSIPYLWVDRYCIDQENAQEKHHLINNMDKIYAGANLTIIAAAGSDPTYGLPGVSSTPRSYEQLQIDIGRMSYMSIPYDSHEIKHGNEWWRRAWTYQEMLLSKRRLLFTPTQVYFECKDMCRQEAIVNCVLGNLPKDTPCGPLLPEEGIGKSAMHIYDRLEEYSKLELSFEDDIIRAFTGIFAAYRSNKFKEGYLHQLWGTPILAPENKNETNVTSSFVKGLAWTVAVVKPTLKKRQGNWPSWSWTSIKEGIDFSPGGFRKLQSVVDVTIQHLNGSRLDIAEYAHGHHDQDDFHSWIDLTCWNMRCKPDFDHNRWLYERRNDTEAFLIVRGGYIDVYGQNLLGRPPAAGLMFIFLGFAHSNTVALFLVAININQGEEMKEGDVNEKVNSWERVGLMRLEFRSIIENEDIKYWLECKVKEDFAEVALLEPQSWEHGTVRLG